VSLRLFVLVVALGLAATASSAAAQAPIGGPPGQQPRPIPTSTPVGGSNQPPAPQAAASSPTPAPAPPPPNQPGPQPPPGQQSPTSGNQSPTATWTPVPTWTPLPTPTPVNTPTPTPFPTFVPQITPTLAWPTPAPGAFFRSRFLAVAPDPSIPAASGAGAIRGRVVDWRGIGIDHFRLHVVGEKGQAETTTLGDGQYTLLNVPPGTYDVELPDYASEPAKDIPVMAGRATTLDWVETNRNEGAPVPQITPTVAVAPSPTATPVPAALVSRPPTNPARPPPIEVVALGIVARAAETMFNAFLTGAAIVAVAAVITIALVRWRSPS